MSTSPPNKIHSNIYRTDTVLVFQRFKKCPATVSLIEARNLPGSLWILLPSSNSSKLHKEMRSHGIYTNSHIRHKWIPLSTVQQKNKLPWMLPKCRSGYIITVLNLAKSTWNIYTETGWGMGGTRRCTVLFFLFYLWLKIIFNLHLYFLYKYKIVTYN